MQKMKLRPRARKLYLLGHLGKSIGDYEVRYL